MIGCQSLGNVFGRLKLQSLCSREIDKERERERKRRYSVKQVQMSLVCVGVCGREKNRVLTILCLSVDEEHL